MPAILEILTSNAYTGVRRRKGTAGGNVVRAQTQCQFCILSRFQLKIWGRPRPKYHGTQSISEAFFHTPPLSTNTIAPDDKKRSTLVVKSVRCW